MTNLDLFDTDPHIPDIVREYSQYLANIQETRERVEKALTNEEIETLSKLIQEKLSPIELARMECNHILLALIKK